MPLTPEQAATATDALAGELRNRLSTIEQHNRYYAGNHRLRFASDEFRNYFDDRYRDFSDNWVGVVADAPTERLQITGFRPSGAEDASDGLWDLWQRNEADGLSDQAMLESILHGRSFSLVWGEDGDITFEDPSQAIVGYEPGSRRRRAGLKLWRDDNLEFATLYTPDEVWKFQRKAEPETGLQLPWSARRFGEGDWEQRQGLDEPWPLANPLESVPLIEWENRPRLAHPPMSDVAGTIAMQDAINLMWAYLFNTADFASFPQRVVLGQEKPTAPILDDNGVEIGRREIDLKKFAVDRVVWLEAPEANIDQWDAARLNVFTEVIKHQVEHLAAQTRTPHHYLVGKMANLSADALRAAETGLNKRTEEKWFPFGRAARETMSLSARARGDEALSQAMAGGTVLWADAEVRSRAQTVDELLKLKSIGFPFKFLAERLGLTPPEVERVMEMRDEETEALLSGDFTSLFDKPDEADLTAA